MNSRNQKLWLSVPHKKMMAKKYYSFMYQYRIQKLKQCEGSVWLGTVFFKGEQLAQRWSVTNRTIPSTFLVNVQCSLFPPSAQVLLFYIFTHPLLSVQFYVMGKQDRVLPSHKLRYLTNPVQPGLFCKNLCNSLII